ncbi:MAG: HAMP domain-containing protein [Rhodocyclales bacterium]|nr:HAMP domain-containing protein [Rhodocyclales bacterium]
MKTALLLFLRRFLLLFGGAFVGVFLVQLVADQWLAPIEDAHVRELVRGQLYHLHGELAPMDGHARVAHLARLQPHYGLELSLLATGNAALTPEESALLAARQPVLRDDATRFLTQLDADTLLQVSAPPHPAELVWAALSNLMFLLIMAGLVGGWVWRYWRDLQTLTGTAERIGAGELSARAHVRPRSDLRPLATDFNAMAERLERLAGLQRQLINGVAHELRTPIARIGFALDLLAEESGLEAQNARAESMREDLRELDALIREMLSYAQLQQASRPPRLEVVAAAAWLDSVLGPLMLEAQARHVRIEIAAPPPATVSLEPRLMARAAHNLLRNALRHARQRIELRLHHADGQTMLIVDDDGPGIPPTDRATLFEPFSRLDASRSRDTGGFGLGLAIVDQVARAHHGGASVEDAPIGGARFTISWPDAN